MLEISRNNRGENNIHVGNESIVISFFTEQQNILAFFGLLQLQHDY